MGRRSGRTAAKRAAVRTGSTTRRFDELDEEEGSADAQASDQMADDSEGLTAIVDSDENDDDVDMDGEGASPGDMDGPADSEADKEPSPAPQPVIRRRRLGRPPKNRPADWDQLPIERPVRDPNETPRRRGRGGWRGRGGRRGQVTQATQQTIDKDGTVMDIRDDELALPEDAEGETKVDKNGNLQGDREYRCRTFKVPGRGDRLYMLSTEPARCVGFRDSYLFFTKHKRLYKIIVGDEEKRDMIQRNIIPHSYKGRSIGIVTARSVFREFGALIVVGGRKIIDDYEVAARRAEGAVEGEVADPADAYVPGGVYNRNQFVAWHGASSVYHSGLPTVPTPAGKPDLRKIRAPVTDANWKLEHAKAAANFNALAGARRRRNLSGVYDVYTNSMHYPAHMQPTTVRIEEVVDSAVETGSALFPPLHPNVPRNFKVVDVKMESPSTGIADAVFRKAPPPDFLKDFAGLDAVSDEIKDCLPPECRAAFDRALAGEKEWKAKWSTEAEGTHRQQPIIDAAIVGYQKMP